jgi:hypothetical protein
MAQLQKISESKANSRIKYITYSSLFHRLIAFIWIPQKRFALSPTSLFRLDPAGKKRKGTPHPFNPVGVRAWVACGSPGLTPSSFSPSKRGTGNVSLLEEYISGKQDFFDQQEVSMINREQKPIIADLSQSVITQMAPNELLHFRAVSATYFRNPERVQREQETVRFNADAAVAFLTPYVLIIATEVVKYIFAELQKTLATESAGVVSRLLKQWFKKIAAPEQPPAPLSAEQLAEVRKIAYEKALLLHLSEEQAQLLADAIKGSLAR